MDLKLCIKILQILWQKPFVSWILGWRNYSMYAHVHMFLCSNIFYPCLSTFLCSCQFASILETFSMLMSVCFYARAHIFLCSNRFYARIPMFICFCPYVFMLKFFSMLIFICFHARTYSMTVCFCAPARMFLYSCLYVSLPSMTCTTVWSLWVHKIRSSNSMTRYKDFYKPIRFKIWISPPPSYYMRFYAWMYRFIWHARYLFL